ncbi:MAG: hypothetical protein HOO06_03870 [Bdellovibrionaceae bacterium]|mgnify:CR=1|jgi:hypothetical protein|nr:hypothetical protein [Pseudobdellovibrionaceae bacterium]
MKNLLIGVVFFLYAGSINAADSNKTLKLHVGQEVLARCFWGGAVRAVIEGFHIRDGNMSGHGNIKSVPYPSDYGYIVELYEDNFWMNRHQQRFVEDLRLCDSSEGVYGEVEEDSILPYNRASQLGYHKSEGIWPFNNEYIAYRKIGDKLLAECEGDHYEATIVDITRTGLFALKFENIQDKHLSHLISQKCENGYYKKGIYKFPKAWNFEEIE